MFLSKIIIENFRRFGEGANRFELTLRPGLTALVGENDAGKTALIDALRFVLGTTDQEWFRLEDSDFHDGASTKEIRIICKFEELASGDQRAFLEYLSYDEEAENEPVFYINWTATDAGETAKGRPFRRVEVHSGKNGDGPNIDPRARELLRATYLRPLRDVERALSAGRGSRLSQVLHHTEEIKTGGEGYNRNIRVRDLATLNVLGIGDLANRLLEDQEGVKSTVEKINDHLDRLSLQGDAVRSNIRVSGSTASDDARLRQLLEKLDLAFGGVGQQAGKPGLGSDNLLFMSCELLLLAQENEGNRLLLIEEPEAHLHAQRQLHVMRWLQDQAEERGIQVIVTTHSPNLASAIKLDNIVVIHKGRAFSMAEEETELETTDRRFLERFLDVTKANLFFARGVMIVEGDAENILLPTIAKILDRDFTQHGVSIVNVGGVGLRRYARIFQRKNLRENGLLEIPVSCLTDMDVMPDCAPVMIGKIKEGAEWPEKNERRWRAKADFKNEKELIEERIKKVGKASGQFVLSFLSDEWTLEYDLALGPRDQEGGFPGGLAEDIFISACLADKDDAINAHKTTTTKVAKTATEEFSALKKKSRKQKGCTREEVIASRIYAKFAKDNGVSKAIAAQYLAERLLQKFDNGTLTSEQLRASLPEYLIDAIDYVTGNDEQETGISEEATANE